MAPTITGYSAVARTGEPPGASHYPLHAMSGLDNLPPDQRAVLQLVLARGRSYDEIAGMLSIDREAVRRRALDALDALTPAACSPGLSARR